MWWGCGGGGGARGGGMCHITITFIADRKDFSNQMYNNQTENYTFTFVYSNQMYNNQTENYTFTFTDSFEFFICLSLVFFYNLFCDRAGPGCSKLTT